MADIRVNSTGKIFWGIDNGVALLLQEAFPEAFAHAGKPQPQPAPGPLTPTYFVGRTNSQSAAFVIVRRQGATEMYLSGTVEQIKRAYPDCPANVLAAWAATPERERAAMTQGIPGAGKFSANTNDKAR